MFHPLDRLFNVWRFGRPIEVLIPIREAASKRLGGLVKEGAEIL